MDKQNKKPKNQTNKSKKDSHINEIEEYNLVSQIIQQEIETNNYFKDTEKNLFLIYEEIRDATIEYCKKMLEISKKLKPNDKSSEGKIQKLIFEVLTNSSKAMEDAVKKFYDRKNDNSYMYEEFEKNKEDLEEEYAEKIRLMDEKRKSYILEMKNYEIYLINKELGLLESKNENESNKKEKKKKGKDKELPIENNYDKVYKQQESLFSSKDDLRKCLKSIFFAINTERKLTYNSLIRNCENLLNVINTGLSKLNEIISNLIESITKKPLELNNNLINEENIINQILKEDLYTFKFISISKKKEEENNEEESKNKKKKKEKTKKNDIDSINDLLEKLEENNILNMLNEVKNNKISLSKKSNNKLILLENKKYIETKIELIINKPDEYDKETKEKLNSLLESNEEYQMTFMKYLNNYRARGEFILKKVSITNLCDLFKIIVDSAIKSKNYKLIKLSMILSLTYYHLKEEKNETNKTNENNEENKIYMTEYLKQFESYQELPFWLNYLEALINEEIERINKGNELPINEKKKSVIINSNIFTLIKSMIDYGLDEQLILKVLDEIYNNYEINVTDKGDILNFLTTEMKEKKKDNK